MGTPSSQSRSPRPISVPFTMEWQRQLNGQTGTEVPQALTDTWRQLNLGHA